MTKVTGTRKERANVISASEFEATLDKARQESNQYNRLRATAILCLFYLTGKRVKEISQLKQSDLAIRENYLCVTFTLAKKRKKQTLTVRREKQIDLAEPYAQPIIEYWKWLSQNLPSNEWLFPSVRASPFSDALRFGDKHLSTRQLLRIVQRYNPSIWCHLFRETVGAKIVRADPTIMSVWKVKKRLDLEKTETAWRYMDRYGLDVIEKEG